MEDIVKKVLTYGGNYLARPLGNAFKEGLDLGNPFAAISYTFLDVVTKANSFVNRTFKFAGGVTYLALTVKDLVKIANSDYESLTDLPFNASMAVSLMRDAKRANNTLDTNLIKDFSKVFRGKKPVGDII